MLGVRSLRKMEVANPGHAGSHFFLTHGKDVAIYYRLESIGGNKI